MTYNMAGVAGDQVLRGMHSMIAAAAPKVVLHHEK